MSTVVHELAAMPVAASGYEVGPLAPADGRSVERRALLVRYHLTSVGKGLNAKVGARAATSIAAAEATISPHHGSHHLRRA